MAIAAVIYVCFTFQTVCQKPSESVCSPGDGMAGTAEGHR